MSGSGRVEECELEWEGGRVGVGVGGWQSGSGSGRVDELEWEWEGGRVGVGGGRWKSWSGSGIGVELKLWEELRIYNIAQMVGGAL